MLTSPDCNPGWFEKSGTRIDLGCSSIFIATGKYQENKTRIIFSFHKKFFCCELKGHAYSKSSTMLQADTQQAGAFRSTLIFLW
jgi:hypothetical protein